MARSVAFHVCRLMVWRSLHGVPENTWSFRSWGIPPPKEYPGMHEGPRLMSTASAWLPAGIVYTGDTTPAPG
jgi:hypothetical protein